MKRRKAASYDYQNLILATVTAALFGVFLGLLRRCPGKAFDIALFLGWQFLAPFDGSALYPGRGLTVPEKLAGKAVLIMGGASGPCFGAAKRFHALGADVLLTGHEARRAQEAASSVAKATGALGRASGVPLDPSDFHQVRLFAQEVIDFYPTGVDFLFLSGGATHDLGHSQTDDAEWLSKSGHNRVMAANHLGPFLLTLLLAPHLAPGAVIVVMGSITAWWANFDHLMLSWGSTPIPFSEVPEESRPLRLGEGMDEASKLAGLLFARSLRPKVAERNITVIYYSGELDSSSDRDGDAVFESSMVTMKPVPDVVYPHWFPTFYVGSLVSQENFPVRAASAHLGSYPYESAASFLMRPERLFRHRGSTVYGSIGPSSSEDFNQKLWAWSREAVGLPERFDEGDIFADRLLTVAGPVAKMSRFFGSATGITGSLVAAAVAVKARLLVT